MIVKFLASRKAKGSKAVQYLLDIERHKAFKPKIIKGNQILTETLIKNNKHKQKATMGVLSFEEKNIDEKLKYKLMADFEKVLFPNMTYENYNILWVEHRDKGRLELNFVVPKIELTTRKSLNPYWDKFDRTRINQWREIQNLKYDLSSPEDLRKKRTTSHENEQTDQKGLTPNRQKNIKAAQIDKYIVENIASFQNRDEILAFLNEKEEIYKAEGKKTYIALYFDSEQTKSTRLKGLYANEQFRTPRELEKLIEQEQERIREQQEKRSKSNKAYEIIRLEEKLKISVDKKIAQLSKLYASAYSIDNSDNISIQDTDSRTIDDYIEETKRRRDNKIKELAEERRKAEEARKEAEQQARLRELEIERIRIERKKSENKGNQPKPSTIESGQVPEIEKRISNQDESIRSKTVQQRSEHGLNEGKKEIKKNELDRRATEIYIRDCIKGDVELNETLQELHRRKGANTKAIDGIRERIIRNQEDSRFIIEYNRKQYDGIINDFTSRVRQILGKFKKSISNTFKNQKISKNKSRSM